MTLLPRIKAWFGSRQRKNLAWKGGPLFMVVNRHPLKSLAGSQLPLRPWLFPHPHTHFPLKGHLFTYRRHKHACYFCWAQILCHVISQNKASVVLWTLTHHVLVAIRLNSYIPLPQEKYILITYYLNYSPVMWQITPPPPKEQFRPFSADLAQITSNCYFFVMCHMY